MIREANCQVKVGVETKVLWKALAKDLKSIIPKIMPDIIQSVEVVEGDGGLGTVFLFNFGSGVSSMSHQKEKLVDVDESIHMIGLQVVEGGYLNLGFSSYKTVFQLTGANHDETVVDIKVVYETCVEADDCRLNAKWPESTLKSSVSFIRQLENYLLSLCGTQKQAGRSNLSSSSTCEKITM